MKQTHMALLLVALSGCTLTGENPDAGPNYPGAPVVVLGNGGPGETHAPLVDGQGVEVVAGLQGGHHIWGSLRVENVNPQTLMCEFELRSGTQRVGGISRQGLRFTQVGPYAHELVGLTLLFDDTYDPQAWDGGVPVSIQASVQDGTGRRAESNHTVMATCCAGQ